MPIAKRYKNITVMT